MAESSARGYIMATDSVRSTVSFDALVTAIVSLSLADKQRLLDLVEEQVGHAEEDAWERDPVVSAEMQRSRDECAAGDAVSLEEYLAARANFGVTRRTSSSLSSFTATGEVRS
jgi:hypothetical protein